MHWNGHRAVSDEQVTLRLVSPAEHLPDLRSGPYALAEDAMALAENTVHRLTVPENAPRGLYLLQVRLWRPEGEVYARTPSGAGQGSLYLRPVRVTQGSPVPPDAPVLALVGSDIRLHTAKLEPSPDAQHLTVQLEWSTLRRLAANYGISIRLMDPEGKLRIQIDTQPGYGFAPTSLWQPGERMADRYVLPLPEDLPAGQGYRLGFVFYQVPTVTEVARVELGPFALPLESPFDFAPVRTSLSCRSFSICSTSITPTA